MTHKQKAEDLINKFGLTQIAILAAQEIWDGIDKNFNAHPDKPNLSEMHRNKINQYWKDVIEELENKLLSTRSEQIALLENYSTFLCANGYMDSDWRDEPPYAIDEFLKLTSRKS